MNLLSLIMLTRFFTTECRSQGGRSITPLYFLFCLSKPTKYDDFKIPAVWSEIRVCCPRPSSVRSTSGGGNARCERGDAVRPSKTPTQVITAPCIYSRDVGSELPIITKKYIITVLSTGLLADYPFTRFAIVRGQYYLSCFMPHAVCPSPKSQSKSRAIPGHYKSLKQILVHSSS